MEDCKAISTPMDPSIKLSKDMSLKSPQERKKVKGIPYQNVIGSLMYAMLGTRPDLAFAVGTTS